MRQIEFFFDVVSPYAWLAFERLPVALAGCSYEMVYRPVLLAGLLKHWGQRGPAEIAPKRDWTYRQIAWLAHVHGLPLRMPAAHPFNPLACLRLLLAHGLSTGQPGGANRHACATVLGQVWRSGGSADDPAVADALADRLGTDPGAAQALRVAARGEAVRQLLRENTAQAAACGVFGVPTCRVEDRLFWGLDALDMLAAFLRGEDWFSGDGWEAAARVPLGAVRREASA